MYFSRNTKMKNYRLSRITGALVLAMSLSAPVIANETSSGFTGQILTPTGTAAVNTKIIVTHIPSGTVKEIFTNDNGYYNLQGLRVGGPYKVVIDSEKYQDQEIQNIFLQVGKAQRISVELKDATSEVIEVYGNRPVGYTNSGSSGSWGSEEIRNAAGGNRDLKDILRSNPLVTVSTDSDSTMSIAGQNPRYNSFTVDGVRQNDDFGLNSNGYPTQRSPISVDAIDQVSVETTPYSVRNGGFSGGQINAVTKSGTNEFHGSLSYEKEDSAWAGTPKTPDGDEVELDFESTTYAATLGGPIIEDKLFFFLSYENYDEPQQLEFGPDGSTAPNASQASLADYNAVREIAQEIYGVDAGTWDKSPQLEDEKILAKIDWNINDDHRASFTYQKTEGNSTRNTSSNAYELKLSTHWYDKIENLESFAAHLYSSWTNDFSTEFKVAYKEVESIAATETKAFGDITVSTDSGDIAFGPDKSRHGNELANETLSMRFLGDYLYEDHEISFGFEYESIDVTNLYAPSSLGTWTFASLEDFENRLANEFIYENSYTGDVNDAAAQFEFSTTSLFLEDSYQVNDDLRITAGVRYEVINTDDKPSHNDNFQARYGFSNSVTLDGESIFLPRISFEYDVNEDIVVRGGVGKFSGGRPNVWLSNAYSNDGVTFVTATNTADYLENTDITSIPQGVQDNLQAGDGNVNVTDPNMKLPSDWRSSIAVDYSFEVPNMGSDWFWSTEYIYVKKKDDPFWVDLTRQQSGTTSAGRPIYEAIDNLTGETTERYDLMLTNADEDGRSKIFSTSLSSAFENGLSFNMSYTNQDITEGTPGTSSTATSNYQYPITYERGTAEIGRGSYEVEHSFKINLDYKVEFVDNYATKFNLFFERRSGLPISYVLGSYQDTGLGDQGAFDDSDAYLPYIPTGADDANVVYSGDLNYETFKEYIDQAGLSGAAGGYASKGSASSPWVTRLDLNITQEIPGFAKGHKGEVYFNIRNLLNMIDHSKGDALRSQYGSKILVDYDIDDQGRYVYSEPYGGFDSTNYDAFDAQQSAWGVKIGVRYRF